MHLKALPHGLVEHTQLFRVSFGTTEGEQVGPPPEQAVGLLSRASTILGIVVGRAEERILGIGRNNTMSQQALGPLDNTKKVSYKRLTYLDGTRHIVSLLLEDLVDPQQRLARLGVHHGPLHVLQDNVHRI